MTTPRLIAEFLAAVERGDKGTAISLLQQAVEPFNRRELDPVFEFLDPEVEWLPPPRSIEPARRGHAGVRELFESWFESWEHLRIEVEDVFRAGDELAVFVRQSGQGRGSGVEVAVRVAYLWTLRDGKVVRFQLFPERREALRAAGLDAAEDE